MAAVWRTLIQEEGDSLFDRLASVTRSVIAPIVRRKLHATLDPADTNQRNLDALDLVSEIRVTVLAELTKHSPNGDGCEIRDLQSFTSTVASNACYQYLRARFPVRTQQCNRLRYVLTHRKGYAMWKDTAGRVLCGLEKWASDEAAPVPLDHLAGEVLHPAARADDPRAYIAAVESVLDRSNGPVRFDDLVEQLMSTFGLTERVEVQSGSDVGRFDAEGVVADPAPRPDQKLENADALAKLWKGVKELTLNQRCALLLNLRAGRSEGLINVLPLSGIASVREIAEVLEFDAVEFASIWNSLPWDDLRIAEHLGVTRQRVINFRHSARAKLARFCRL